MTGFQSPAGAAAQGNCWWCQKRSAEDEHRFAMFRNASRSTRLEGAKRVETTTWDSLTVPIPVCHECKRAHVEATSARDRVWLFVGAGILGWIVSLALAVAFHLPGWLPWLILLSCVVVGVVVSRPQATGKLRAVGTNRYRAGASYPTVQQLRAEKWKPGKPGTFIKNRAQFEYF